MPRRRSSGRRSVSTPVSARISAVLPWSMWPAVPSVSGEAVTGVDDAPTGGSRPRNARGPAAQVLGAQLGDVAARLGQVGAPGQLAPDLARAEGEVGPQHPPEAAE